MGAGAEERILRRAIDKGLIDEGDVDSAATGSGPWGPRLEKLISDGHLDEFAVAALAEEVRALGGESPDGQTMEATPRAGGIDLDSLRSWDRYRVVGSIGSGGGGEVFRARDLELDRNVALKFLHNDRVELVARFRREAQAQARIEHEHICKVYEVGEKNGRSFIAMQFIDGETFGKAANEMPLEERVRVVRQVAEAVHAAHRLGIVHRDLKPGNVIVERNADGAWKPWVLDFGLAREMDQAAVTQSSLAGTPAFMAPEQAQGEAAQIDRRCDVYGLGATLFAVVAGRPPFVGSAAEVIAQLVADEPPPLRRVVPTVPRDLATIVDKCLARDPTRRYESARALADELGRFLDGDPILARPISWAQRLLKRARRQRALVAVSATAVGVAAVLATLWVREVVSARGQAQLALQFGQEAQAVESAMRVAHLLPLHDIRADRAAVKQRIAAVEEAMNRGGAAAIGPGHYALGRGALALGDRAAARMHLERAWQSGYRAPGVAYSLGQVLGEEYEAALESASGIVVKEDREARRQTAAKELRDPALVYLRAGRGAAESPALIEGLIAFREERYDNALTDLDEAARTVPSLYEARRLAGDVYTRMAHNRSVAGDADGAVALTARAASAYRAAVEIARSDASIYVGECQRNFELILLDWDRGRSLDHSVDDALAACDRALAIDPDSTAALRQEAAILWRLGEVEIQKGKDPRPTLARSIAKASAALERDPRDVEALTNLGTAWLTQAENYERRMGIDPRPSLNHAVESYQRAIAIRPTGYSLQDLASTEASLADWEAAHGGDPRPHWQRAIEGFNRATALAPRYSDAYMNLGTVYGSRADHEVKHGLDPRATVELAIAAHKKAIELKPNNPLAYLNLGAAWSFRADWERAQGIDCRPSVEERFRAYRKTVELKPDYIYTYDNFAEAWTLLGVQALDRGADPSEFVKEGRAILAVGRKLNANDMYNYQFLARLELVQARHGGADAPARFADAQTAIARSIEIDPADADSREVEAEIHRWQAERLKLRHESPSGEIARGLEAADRALKINPALPTALAVRGALLSLSGKTEEAQASLKRALELNPLLLRDYPR